MRFFGFAERSVDVGDGTVFVRQAGEGPPLLLLHGFPQTHLMWHIVAPSLAEQLTVVVADLPGYGASRGGASNRHTAYSKRAMAEDLVPMMLANGFGRFGVAGHDRGGRVAYRMALDHPHCVETPGRARHRSH